MASFTPQQQEAISTLDRNVSVSAGAGSGKTRVLVERFLKILQERKATAQEILAITFTRKAAREMRERVQKGILDRLGAAAEPEEKAYWQEQLQLADRAPITTIDSFCSQVLRENPVEAGLDPNFAVKEEYQIRAFREETAQAFVQKEIQQQDGDLAALLDLYPADRLARILVALIDDLPEILALPGGLAAPYEVSLGGEEAGKIEAEGALDALLESRDLAGPKSRAKLDALADQREAIHQWIAAGEYSKASAALKPVSATGKIKDLVKEAKEALARLETLSLDGAGAEQARHWENLLGRFRQALLDAAESREIYSFGYLSGRAVELLEKRPNVLFRYKSRFRYLMVDEFQDTNEEQKRLVYLLSGGSSRSLQGRNLFVVGDAKQSIYRFRGADVSVFRQVRDAIGETGGDNIVMDDNFRSAPEIIEACNTLFDDLLGTDSRSDVTAQPLHPHQPSSRKPVFAVLKKGECTLEECQQAEGRYVAQAIRQLREDTGLPYGQMAILLPAIHLSRQYEEALTALGIKSQVSDGKGFYERQEVVDWISLLTFLLNPRKDWALAGFLRSPYAGISDRQLTDLLKPWPELSLWESLRQSLEEPFVTLSRKLEALHRTALFQSLPELMDDFQEAFAVEPTLLAQRGGREKLANFRKLRALGVKGAMEEGDTARDFLDRLNLMRRLSARESAANQEADPEAVQIMTIHKSKGLEFPAVFLPDLSKKNHNDTLGIQFLPSQGFGVRVPDAQGNLLETSVYTRLKGEKARLERAEKQRQLYVAMTRAEKYLYLINVDESKEGSRPPDPDKEKWGQSLQRVFAPEGPHGDQMDWEELDVAEILENQETGQPGAGEAFVLDPAVYDRVRPVTVPRDLELSASALLEYDTCPRSFYYHYFRHMPGIDPETVGEGSHRISAIDLGTYVHRVLELLQEEPEEEALAEALEVLDRTGAEKKVFAREGRKLVEQYCASPLYQELKDLPAQAERDFALPLFQLEQGRAVFQGSVDRLVTLPDGRLGIVDYKTGHPPADGEEKQGYTRQLTIYALAAEILYPGQKVAWARLHFLQDCSSWELKDREQEEEKLKALVENLLIWDKEEQFPARKEGCQWCPYRYFCPEGTGDPPAVDR